MVARQHLLQKVLHLRHVPLAPARSAARYQSHHPDVIQAVPCLIRSQGELATVTAVVLYVQLRGLLAFDYRICRLPPIRDMGRSDRDEAPNVGAVQVSSVFAGE